LKRNIKYLVLTFLLLSTLLTLYYPPTYIYRVFVWQESDYADGEKFKFSSIKHSSNEFHFNEMDGYLAEQELSRLSKISNQIDFNKFLQERGTYSFLVIRNDTILIEKYFQNCNRETLQNSFSVSKSILGLAVAKAIELGFITDIKEPITKYAPELFDRDPDFAKITIGDLLKMKSGIQYSPETSFPWLNRDDVIAYYHPNLKKVALEKTQISGEPNKEFQYNNYNPLLIGLAMERATKMKLTKFIERYIWSKIGTEFDARWSTDENEFEKMESGFMASPIDMAKIGRLVLENGKFRESQIVSAELMKELTKPISEMKVFEERVWAYGHSWWSISDGTKNPSIMANGHMGQFIFTNPKTNIIIIRNGLKVGQFYDDDWTEIFQSYSNQKMHSPVQEN